MCTSDFRQVDRRGHPILVHGTRAKLSTSRLIDAHSSKTVSYWEWLSARGEQGTSILQLPAS